ncbi:MAG: sigma-70 family RNA polymerase sigma factor [Acidobacteriota bacterium]
MAEATSQMTSMMPRALDDLYAEYHGTVFAAAYRVTGSAADAEDVLHTVFLRLLKQGEAAQLNNPEGYLRRAAVNAALDVVRMRRGADVDLDRMPSRGRGVMDQLQNDDLKRQIRTALAELPERTAEVFVLRHFEGHKNPEIARMLGISQIAVAVTLHRARKKLQDTLRKAGVQQ